MRLYKARFTKGLLAAAEDTWLNFLRVWKGKRPLGLHTLASI